MEGYSDVIMDFKQNRVLLGYYLDRIDTLQYIRIITPIHDAFGELADEEFSNFAEDLRDMRVYGVYVDDEGMTTFDLGVDTKGYDKEPYERTYKGVCG